MIRGLFAPAAFKAVLSAQQGMGFLWVPVGMMPGIALYFNLREEPPALVGFSLLMVLAVLAFWLRHRRISVLLIAASLSAAGFTCAQLRSLQVEGPLLSKELYYRSVEGRIESWEPVEDKVRITLVDLAIEGLAAQEIPKRIRVSRKAESDSELRTGARVRLKAALYPLPMATHPGAYDFARHFYFMGIGGTGFVMSAIEEVEPPPAGEGMRLTNLRMSIASQWMQVLPEPLGALAAALSVGQAGQIPPDVQEDLRDSGLYHILSISGLHISLASGLVFFSMRLLLALWPALCLRVNAKKIAAILGMASAMLYTGLAGAPVPAQRACAMVLFVLFAVLCDRRGITLRSLALAASLILMIFPETLMSTSFQLSFAATLAIVSFHEHGRRGALRGGIVSKMFIYIAAVAVTSLVASLATAPFIIYHFNRVALLSVVANVMVLPLVTFLIMPGLILGLVGMLTGAVWLGVYPLSIGLVGMLWVARWSAQLPYAAVSLPSLAPWALGLAAAGLCLLCLVRGRARLVGVPLLLASLGSLAGHEAADMYISEGAKQVLLRLDDGHYTALRGTERAFAVENWLRSEGENHLVPRKASGVACEQDLCTVDKAGRRLIVVTSEKNTEALDSACEQAPDVLVAPRYLNAERCPQPLLRIGKRELDKGGVHALRIRNGEIEIRRAADTQQRPWHVSPAAYSKESQKEVGMTAQYSID